MSRATYPNLADRTGLTHLSLPYIVIASEIWVDLHEFYYFVKTHHNEDDSKDTPRRNQMNKEVLHYSRGILEEDGKVLLSLSSVLRYCFSHCQDFQICQKITDDVTFALTQSSEKGDTVGIKTTASHDKSLLGLYEEIANNVDMDSVVDIDFDVGDETDLPYIETSYKDHFPVSQWNKIKTFEFQFSAIEIGKQKGHVASQYLSPLMKKKWSFWETCKSSLELGSVLNKLNAAVCSYQTDRKEAADALEGIHLSICGTKHLPQILEKQVMDTMAQYDIDSILGCIAVDCSEICHHYPGCHVFVLVETENLELNNVATLIRGKLKDHVSIPEIVFLGKSSKTLFEAQENEKPRFSLRDKYLTKKLKDDVILVDMERYSSDDGEMTADSICAICFKDYSNWIAKPLSISTFNHLQEWKTFVPMPIRLLLEKTFLNEESIARSEDRKSLIASKIGRLTTIYEAGLNTLNKNYFGMTQEMNTAELIVNYHNATSVFSVTQACGITKSLIAAERSLKKMAAPERCYFRSYLLPHPLNYQALHDNKVDSYNVSLRQCYLIYMVDNLVRIRKKADPAPGECRSSQICTLPITLKGLPRNASITAEWHAENCDGSDLCSCKDSSTLEKEDVERLFLNVTEEESIQLDSLKVEAAWGIKFILQNQKGRKMMEDACQKYNPIDQDDDDLDLSISFDNLSMNEVEQLPVSDLQVDELQVSFCDLDLTEDLNNSIANRDNLNTYEERHHKDNKVCNLHQTINGEEKDEAAAAKWPDDSDSPSASDCDTSDTVSATSDYIHSTDDEYDLIAEELTCMTGDADNSTPSFLNMACNEEDESTFTKFTVPPLLCRHPAPAIGKDDDKYKLRELLDDVLVKSGISVNTERKKDRILVAPDHKIASNLLELMDDPKYMTFLPEFPVLHLVKSKITNLMSGYNNSALLHLLKYMKDDDDESDWKKLVTIAEIEAAARMIKRLSLALHLAFFLRFLESLHPIEADNMLIDLCNTNLTQVQQQWNKSYNQFLDEGSSRNATFCMHRELMQHCDEIVGIQLAQKIGGPQGYALLLALVKASLPFAFLNGASAYASFCVKLLNVHYSAGVFYQNMKETLFTTPHKNFSSNFALDAQREMDHRDAIKGFRPSSTVAAILPRMSVVDDLDKIRKARKAVYFSSDDSQPANNPDREFSFLDKSVINRDIVYATRGAEVIIRMGALETRKDKTPKNVYTKRPETLSVNILDKTTENIGKYLIQKYICMNRIANTTEEDCPNIESVEGPDELKRKLKISKSTTINRAKSKPSLEKTEKDLVEEKRKRELSKLNKLSLHCTSSMNTCQAIVKPDGSKPETSKAKGVKESLAYLLCREQEKETIKGKLPQQLLQEKRADYLASNDLAYFQSKILPKHAVQNVKVVLIEFAGVKFKAFPKSGKQYIEFVQNSLLRGILKQFPNTNHMVVCEEKYCFTPDTLKAMTRAKRKKEDKTDVYHLKVDEEMLSIHSYSRYALTRTEEGKRLASCFLAANIKELDLRYNLILDVDSEHITSECVCGSKVKHELKPCRQFSMPVRAVFQQSDGLISTSTLSGIQQCKGEAEMAQADWLPSIVHELDEDDAVLSYVTSGDIDTLPIHLLITAIYWPRWPNGKFKNTIYLLLQKPRDQKPDIYNITKLTETIEDTLQGQEMPVIVAFLLCLGGNDFIPKFHGISHQDWVSTVITEPRFLKELFTFTYDENTHRICAAKLNEEVYTDVLKKLYCPKDLDHSKMTLDEVRELSIRRPGKSLRNPQQWMPPLSALKKVVCLMNSTLEYLMTVGKPQADLPNFLGNGGIKKTSSGDIEYDLGPDVHYTQETELLKISEDILRNKMAAARKQSKKRGPPNTPSKDQRTVKRRPAYQSTPRKIRSMRKTAEPE